MNLDKLMIVLTLGFIKVYTLIKERNLILSEVCVKCEVPNEKV